MNWNEWFVYDETSPTCLRWATDMASGRGLETCTIKSGRIAGCSRASGKRSQVQLAGTNYYCHNVVWEMFNGVIPSGLEIDHKDRDSQNNRLSNLRLVTHAVNCRNKGKYKHNTSGATGVSITSPR